MLFGQFRTSFDNQGRLTLPDHFRELLSVGAVLTQGFDRNLLVLPRESFQDLYQRIRTMNLADPSARLLLRMILGTACEVETDKSGRVTVPENLREFAGLDGSEAVLVGQGDFLEIWAPALWRKQEIRLQDAEANAERFIQLNVAASQP
jgi:MraZ protein